MHKLIGIIVFIFLSSAAFSIDITLLKRNDSMDLLTKMNANDVFVKWVKGVDVDDKNNIYLMDVRYCTVVVVDSKTGKRIRNISSKGQGPAELNRPAAIRIKNNMIFVVDKGFGGVKIFSLDGNLINEFRTYLNPDWLDINRSGELLIKEAAPDGAPVIAVYDMKGKKQGTLLTFDIKDKNDRSAFILNKKFIFKVDSNNDIIVLHFLKRRISKYSYSGKLLWEKEIANQILDKYDSGDQKIKFGEKSISGTRGVFGLDIDTNDNIIVGHVGGGIIYRKDGSLVNLLAFDPPMNLDLFRFYEDKLLTINAFGHLIHIYKLYKPGKGD